MTNLASAYLEEYSKVRTDMVQIGRFQFEVKELPDSKIMEFISLQAEFAGEEKTVEERLTLLARLVLPTAVIEPTITLNEKPTLVNGIEIDVPINRLKLVHQQLLMERIVALSELSGGLLEQDKSFRGESDGAVDSSDSEILGMPPK